MADFTQPTAAEAAAFKQPTSIDVAGQAAGKLSAEALSSSTPLDGGKAAAGNLPDTLEFTNPYGAAATASGGAKSAGAQVENSAAGADGSAGRAAPGGASGGGDNWASAQGDASQSAHGGGGKDIQAKQGNQPGGGGSGSQSESSGDRSGKNGAGPGGDGSASQSGSSGDQGGKKGSLDKQGGQTGSPDTGLKQLPDGQAGKADLPFAITPNTKLTPMEINIPRSPQPDAAAPKPAPAVDAPTVSSQPTPMIAR